MSARQAGIVWTFATVGLTVVLLMTDKPDRYADRDMGGARHHARCS